MTVATLLLQALRWIGPLAATVFALAYVNARHGISDVAIAPKISIEIELLAAIVGCAVGLGALNAPTFSAGVGAGLWWSSQHLAVRFARSRSRAIYEAEYAEYQRALVDVIRQAMEDGRTIDSKLNAALSAAFEERVERFCPYLTDEDRLEIQTRCGGFQGTGPHIEYVGPKGDVP